MKKYIEYEGTSYNLGTPLSVIHVLEHARKHRYRITLDYGDRKTGKSWGEVNDISGYVGRSNGTYKIPLLIHNSRSSGGGPILTHCIIGIKLAKGGKKVL